MMGTRRQYVFEVKKKKKQETDLRIQNNEVAVVARANETRVRAVRRSFETLNLN